MVELISCQDLPIRCLRAGRVDPEALGTWLEKQSAPLPRSGSERPPSLLRAARRGTFVSSSRSGTCNFPEEGCGPGSFQNRSLSRALLAVCAIAVAPRGIVHRR